MCKKHKKKVDPCKRAARSAKPPKQPRQSKRPVFKSPRSPQSTSPKRRVAKDSKYKKSSGSKQIETFRKFVRAHAPTPRDLRRPMRNDELAELCKRVPCRVDMTRFNRVYDYQQHFEREGRLKNKSYHQVNKLLAKAVNRHKDEVYTQEEIQKARCHEWAERKKDNLMRLRLWKYDRKHEHDDDDDDDDDCD